MSRYAVLDLETTGLSPANHHRIVEVAVVLVDDAGQTVYEWATLVNPERDVTASEIHGLTGADVYRAPTFSQIAGQLTKLLSGRVAVAHNLASIPIPDRRVFKTRRRGPVNPKGRRLVHDEDGFALSIDKRK